MNRKEFAEYVQHRYNQDPNGRFDRFGKEFLKSDNFTIRIIYNAGELTWGEQWIGTSFGSTVDYGRTYKQLQSDDMSEEELRDDVRKRILRSPRQINFIDTNDDFTEVITGVAVVVTKNGYAIHPDPDTVIKLDE